MLHFDHGYVTCLYVPIYLVGDACAQIVAILFISILSCYSALCIFESNILAFVDFFMHYQQGGGKYPIHVSMGSFACREEMHFFGGACIHAFGGTFFA
jgi:hypothetical protein